MAGSSKRRMSETVARIARPKDIKGTIFDFGPKERFKMIQV